MGALLGTLGIFSMLFTAGALIKPESLKKLFKEKTRTKIALTFGLGGFILFIVGVTITPNGGYSNQAPISQSNTQAIATSSAPQDPASQIKAIVGNVLQGQTNESNEPKLRSVDVEPDPAVKDGWDVTVEFNGDNNLSNGLTKDNLVTQTSDVFIALYTSGQKIETATVTGYLPLTDKYGNTSDGMVYRATLITDDASQINWSSDKATLELQILPGVWDLDYVNPAFE
jgi:hypothetical protein